MITALSEVTRSTVDASTATEGLAQYVGTSLRPGALLEIWFMFEKLGELECTVLTETRIELHARGRFLGRAFDVPCKIELGPRDRCTIELGRLRDPEARSCLQLKKWIVISEDLGGHEPSLRVWADREVTKVELRCTVGMLRPVFDLTLVPPRFGTS